MAPGYACLGGLLFDDTGINIINTSCQSRRLSICDYYFSSVLELFINNLSIEETYQAYKALRRAEAVADPAILRSVQNACCGPFNRNALLFIFNRVFVCPPESLQAAYQIVASASGSATPLQYEMKIMMEAHKILDLTNLSQATHLVARAMQAHYLSTVVDYPDLTLEQFIAVVKQLFTDGLLTASIGAINFGDFNRRSPFCPHFGSSRGTPIDRYYLNKFIEELRNDVIGDTLEIGGVKHNQQLYGFTRAKTYQTLDVKRKAGVNIVGDVHNPDLLKSNSLDSIIVFNVLEHCEKPWTAIDNMYNWLKDGGRVLCMVPNAQRIHKLPRDCWRFMPDAINSLFSKFSILKLFVYGNPITTVASLMGIAAEELSGEDLDFHNEEYPVATCVFAQKFIS